MTPDDLKKYYKSGYDFHKKTGMSQGSYGNWRRAGKIPLDSQVKIQRWTRGELKVSFEVGESL